MESALPAYGMQGEPMRTDRLPKLSGRTVALLLLLTGVAVLIGAFLFINAGLRPVLVGLASARVQSVAAKAMNDAVLDVLADAEKTEGLVHVHENETHVYLLEADSARLNILAADCANAAQERIGALGDQGVSIPIGTVSGIPLFAGSGPRILLRFTPAGAVSSSFESEFRSAGINQTLHRINLKLNATVRVILPGESHTLEVGIEAPIAENVIVGGVPNAYTNVANEEDLLNLIPED